MRPMRPALATRRPDRAGLSATPALSSAPFADVALRTATHALSSRMTLHTWKMPHLAAAHLPDLLSALSDCFIRGIKTLERGKADFKDKQTTFPDLVQPSLLGAIARHRAVIDSVATSDHWMT